MANNKIQKMSVDEIFEELGTMIYRHQFICMIGQENIAEGFEEEDIVQYIRKNPDVIDKEKLVFVIAMNLNNWIMDLAEEMKSFPKNEEGQNRARMQALFAKPNYDRYGKAKELLKGSNVEIPIFRENDAMYKVSRFLTVNEFFGERKPNNELRERNLSIINGLEERGLMEMAVYFSNVKDFPEYCYYRGNGQIFTRMIEAYVNQNYQQMKKNEGEMTRKYISYYTDVLKEYAEKIDFEKYLLVLAYRSKYVMEKENIHLGEWTRYTATQIMQYADETIKNKGVKINFYGYPGYSNNGENAYIEYSEKQLRKDVSKIIDGTYFSQNDIATVKEEMLAGISELGIIENKRLFDLLKFSKSEIKAMVSMNPANIEPLVKFGALEEVIKEGIDTAQDFKFSHEFVDEMYAGEVIDKKDLVMMYMRNTVELARIVELNETYGLNDEVTAELLMEYYAQMKENEEKEKDFNRYSLLFREVRLKGKTLEEQVEVADEIMDELYKLDSDYEEDLAILYKERLLPIRSLIEWNGDKMIYDLIVNNSLRPKDAKDLLMSGELDLEKTYDVLKNSKLSDEEKMNFIFSSFDGFGKSQEEVDKQNEARNYLIQTMKISSDLKNQVNHSGNKRDIVHRNRK